jgi:hypothetical protein
MNLFASSRCQEGPDRLTFPDILSDPLVRAMMAADHVDPHALKLDLECHEKLPVGSRSRLRLDGCIHSVCSAVSRTWSFPGSGPPHQLAMANQRCKKMD